MDEEPPEYLIRQDEANKHLEQQRSLHPNDPRNDGSLEELEQAIEDRAAKLIDMGYQEDYAWIKAQDDLCPID